MTARQEIIIGGRAPEEVGGFSERRVNRRFDFGFALVGCGMAWAVLVGGGGDESSSCASPGKAARSSLRHDWWNIRLR